MKYRVINKCYGFLNRMWEKGEVVDSNSFGDRWPEDSENIPKHFEPLEKPVEEVVEEPVDNKMSMTDVSKQQFNAPETVSNTSKKQVAKKASKK